MLTQGLRGGISAVSRRLRPKCPRRPKPAQPGCYRPLRWIQFFFPLDLAREFVRPGQGCLISERGHQHCGAGGVSRTNRKLQSIAQERSHLFKLCDHFEGGLPPPGRGRRSILFRNGSPLRKFASGPLELKFCGWMPLRLGVATLWSASLSRHEVRRFPKRSEERRVG